MRRKNPKRFLTLVVILFGGSCVFAAFTVAGSGLTLWLAMQQPLVTATPTATPTRKLAALLDPTLSPSATPIPTLTETPTLLPTDTATFTPSLTPTFTPTATPVTPSATPLPPPPTPMPTDTPTLVPSFPFIILETEGHETNHLNFDIYLAITDENNKPLSGYRVLGHHSSGLQVDSQTSAGDWTVNSGARQYKGGNLKYEAPNSPTGTWNIQLVDESGQSVAPEIALPFDATNPFWYFILYRRVD